MLGAGELVAPSERFVVVIDGGQGAATNTDCQAPIHQLAADL